MRPGAEGGWTEALFYGPSWILIHFAYNAHGRYILLEGGITLFFNRASDSLWASQVVLVGKNLPANAGDVRDVDLIPGSGRSPRGGAWQSTPVFLPGESHGQRSLAGYSP